MKTIGTGWQPEKLTFIYLCLYMSLSCKFLLDHLCIFWFIKLWDQPVLKTACFQISNYLCGCSLKLFQDLNVFLHTMGPCLHTVLHMKYVLYTIRKSHSDSSCFQKFLFTTPSTDLAFAAALMHCTLGLRLSVTITSRLRSFIYAAILCLIELSCIWHLACSKQKFCCRIHFMSYMHHFTLLRIEFYR